jgi:catechol 2,3-dioxygenase-like lactoylglutathione lyase family enzyme
MSQALGLVSVVVRDYDEALSFYLGVLGFDLTEDTRVPE